MPLKVAISIETGYKRAVKYMKVHFACRFVMLLVPPHVETDVMHYKTYFTSINDYIFLALGNWRVASVEFLNH